MARIPYGYIKEGEGYQVDDSAGAIVERIFIEFCHPYQRAGLLEIAHGLNLDEVTTQRGGQWHASTVAYVLQNDAYVGLRGFPAIISRDLFDCAQSRLAALQFGPTR